MVGFDLLGVGWTRGLLRSIAFRLSFGIGVVALLTFAGIGVMLYRMLATELWRNETQELVGKFELVQHFIDEAGPSGGLDALKHHLDDALIGHGGLQLWLLGSGQVVLYGSGGSPQIPAQPDLEDSQKIYLDNGVALRSLRRPVRNAAPFGISEVLIGIDTRPREKLLHVFRREMEWIFGLGLLSNIIASGLIAKLGLHPLKDLTIQAGKLDPQKLDARLSGDKVDIELEGFVKAFNNSLQRIETAYEQMEAFNADVAHELRTPLAVLINGAQINLAAPRTAAELREVLGAGLEDLDRLKQIVNDMLFLAQADRGVLEKEFRKVALVEELEKVTEFYAAQLEEAGLHVIITGEATLPCDSSLVQRAIANLLSNAIKFTARNATIRISLETVGNRVRLSVFNPGVPMKAAVANRIFDRFYRASASHAGHGLGLAIVAAIARVHGGSTFAKPVIEGNHVGIELPL